MAARDRIVAGIAERQLGVFSFSRALEAGYSPASIQRKVQGGQWRRVGSGVYAISGVPFTFASRVLARTLEVDDAVASHRTAAALHRLDGFTQPARIELMVFDRRGIASGDVIVHRPRVWLPDDRTSAGGVPTTSVARTLFDLASDCRIRALEIAFDDALRKGAVTVEQMARRMQEVRRPGVRGIKKMSLVIADRAANDLEDSELEAIFRKLVASSRLPQPTLHYKIWREDGSFVAEVDFAYPEIRLAVELDSWTYHASRRSFDDDRVKQYELLDLGWECLRFTTSDVRRRRERVVSVLRHRLAALGRIDIT